MIAMFWLGYVLLMLSLLARCYYRTFLARRLQLAGAATFTLLLVTWAVL